MKTRSEQEMLSLILGFAGDDDRIRVVVMNGSRVNPAISPDPFQDYDIANFVTDVEPFRNSEYVIPHFGPVIVVEQPLIGPWSPDDPAGPYHNYNMQFVDGNRIDLSFVDIGKMKDQLSDSLSKVLLDKDNLVPSLPTPNESSYYLTEPTRLRYEGCCSAFYFALSSHIPKTIWRRQLPKLKNIIEGWLRQPLVMMLEWEIGIRTGWGKTIGPSGRDLEHHLSADVWNEYTKTYVDFDYDRLWESLFRLLDLFNGAGQSVAESRGYYFPEGTASKVRAFLEHVRSMPADASTIY